MFFPVVSVYIKGFFSQRPSTEIVWSYSMVGMTHEMNLRKRKRKKEKNAYHNTGRMEVEEW